jgi:hypothetical protein
MKKIIFVLLLLSFNAQAQTMKDFSRSDFRMKCVSIYTNGTFKGVLCEDETNSCIIPENSKQQPVCVKK